MGMDASRMFKSYQMGMELPDKVSTRNWRNVLIRYLRGLLLKRMLY